MIQVVPQLKPGRCGVSDHAVSLARELQSSFGVIAAFVVLNSIRSCDLPYPQIYCPPSELHAACQTLARSKPAAIITHVSGYGYSADGAPTGLADALEDISRDAQFSSAAYYHELFAPEWRPWKSAFWYEARQKRAILRIARSSKVIVTNTSQNASWIRDHAALPALTSVLAVAMFSNVGESDVLPTFDTRRRAMVIFGLAHTRRRSYERLLRMGETLEKLQIEEIVDIGPELDVPGSVSGIKVRPEGILPAPDLAAVLSQSMFGFVQHKPVGLAKSGVFAGFCAFGTIPVVATPFSEEIDGLQDGVQVISSKTASLALSRGLEHCSSSAWQWYRAHRVFEHAAVYAQHLIDAPEPVSEAGKVKAQCHHG